jgi:hypothetical protein
MMEDYSRAGRRRSWNEIVTYYGRSIEEVAYYTQLDPEFRCPSYALMLEFAKLARDDERFASLVTVGAVGSVMIYRNSECGAADEHIEVGPGRSHTSAEIVTCYRDAARLAVVCATFQEAGSALQHFASLLREHGFLDRPA